MKRLLALPLAIIRLLFTSAWLALGQIWANKTRSILTTIGIVIGVASVTAVIATLSGLKTKVLTEIESFGTNNIYIGPTRPDKGPLRHASWQRIRFLTEHFNDLLKHCPSVEQFTRSSWAGRQTIRHAEKSMEGVRVYGVEPAWHEVASRPVIFGRPLSIIDEAQGRYVCLIDPELRDKLGLDRDCVGQSVLMSGKTFRIAGVIERRPETAMIGGGGQDDFEMFIPFRTHLKLATPMIWAIAASKSTEVSAEAQAEIAFFLRRTRHIKPGEPDTFRIQSVESALEKFNKVALMITLVAGGVVGISLLVGGVGIMNIMLVSVSERTREIGLRKAVGAKKTAILTQFLVEAIVLCFIGGLVGVCVGHLLTLGITAINPVMDQTHIPTWAIVLSFAFAGSVGLFFGMFPAIKAARLDPIEALRHE